MTYKIDRQARCAVIGYGSWATALVKILLENESAVGWYIRNNEVLEHIRQHKTNPRYLRDVHFYTNNLKLSDDINTVVSEADVLILAVPSVYLKTTLEPLTVSLQDKFVISAIKGIVPEDYVTVTEYVNRRYGVPFDQLGIISGPCHAEEVALERLSYLTVVCKEMENSLSLGEKIGTSYINVSHSTDIYGTEYASVLKNIYAIAVGRAKHFRIGLPGRPAGNFLLPIQPQPPVRTDDRQRLPGTIGADGDEHGSRRLLRERMHHTDQQEIRRRDADCRNGPPHFVRQRKTGSAYRETDRTPDLINHPKEQKASTCLHV